jgi:flagellar hook assembly protein FlgD
MIQYGLPVRSRTELTVYNILGQKVRTVFSGIQDAGQRRVVWDGRNDTGVAAASGVYIYRIETRSLDDGRAFQQSRKMILIK